MAARARTPVRALALSGAGAALALLAATGAAAGSPSLRVDPASWDFGAIDTGTTASRTFTFTNTGGAATGALTASLPNSSAAFTLTADTCTGRSLGPRRSCTVTVRYAPGPDTTDTGTLRVASRRDAAEAALSGRATPTVAVQITPDPDVIASATLGAPVLRNYTITNSGSAFTGRATGSALGSARLAVPTIADAASSEFAVTVTPGASSLLAAIGDPSDPGADLDLLVFDCTTGTCVPAGSSADGDSEESVLVPNPAPGQWRVRVDAYAVPAGTTTFRYRDVFTSPVFGSVNVADVDTPRARGATWNVPGTVTASVPPAAGRVLLGHVRVRTATGALLEESDVIVQDVS